MHALSFEYTPPALDLVELCSRRLSDLGAYEYNWSPGETMEMHWSGWVDARTLSDYLMN